MFSKKKKKTMKKILILFAIFFIGILSAKAGYSFSYTYQGKTLCYEITSSNTVGVTQGYHDIYDTIIIPSKITVEGTTYSVTSIDDYAFSGCSGLTSITIPNSVTKIDKSAFSDRSGLTSITISNSVTSIDDYAFSGCSGLESIVVESGNTIYDSRNNCNAIIETSTNKLIAGCKNTIIPNSVTSIDNGAFDGCSSLTSITIPNSVKSIGSYAFYDCSSLTSITIPNSVKSIGERAFHGCSSLTSITIPNSVTAIGGSAFSGCSSLTSITIPNSVTYIGGYAFYGCSSLTSITIPNSVTSIGQFAFLGCSGLESIVVESGNPKYDSRNNCNAIIETSTNKLIVGCKNTIIPNSVTSIGSYAFDGRSSLISITIPNSVTSIGSGAFSDCSGLESIVVESGNSIYDSRNNCNAIIETSTNNLIAGCKNTIIPNSVTSIGSSAFSGCSGLTSITIPNSVTSIGNSTFEGCSSLTSVTIPNSVTSIGDDTFCNCSSLDTITINSNEACRALWKDYGYIDTTTKPRILIIGNSVTSIGNGAFDGCSSLTSITIPNSVTEIGWSAFRGCSSLTSITIPNSVTYIGGCAFALCTSLTSITIPNSVTKIDIETFYGCKSLRIIELPASLNNINTAAFYNCSKIHTIYSRNTTPPIVGKCYTFENVPRDAKLYVPNGSVEAYKQANVWKEFYNIKGYDFDDTTNVGIQDINISDNITLYPNPADKEINISLKNMDLNGSKIFIYDLQGNLVKSFKILDNKDNILLDISSLSKGTYTIVVVSDNKTKVTQKLIKR